jgi:hypothetical protein
MAMVRKKVIGTAAGKMLMDTTQGCCSDPALYIYIKQEEKENKLILNLFFE